MLLPCLFGAIDGPQARVPARDVPKDKLVGQGARAPVVADGNWLAAAHGGGDVLWEAVGGPGDEGQHVLCRGGPGGDPEGQRRDGDARLLVGLAEGGGVDVLADVLAALGQLRDARVRVVDDGDLARGRVDDDAPARDDEAGRRRASHQELGRGDGVVGQRGAAGGELVLELRVASAAGAVGDLFHGFYLRVLGTFLVVGRRLMPRGRQFSMAGICMLRLGVLWFREGLCVVGLDSHETWRARVIGVYRHGEAQHELFFFFT